MTINSFVARPLNKPSNTLEPIHPPIWRYAIAGRYTVLIHCSRFIQTTMCNPHNTAEKGNANEPARQAGHGREDPTQFRGHPARGRRRLHHLWAALLPLRLLRGLRAGLPPHQHADRRVRQHLRRVRHDLLPVRRLLGRPGQHPPAAVAVADRHRTRRLHPSAAAELPRARGPCTRSGASPRCSRFGRAASRRCASCPAPRTRASPSAGSRARAAWPPRS